MDATESKTEFAARCNVSPGRVSQWIKAGQISASSLVGEGRASKIRIEAAIADLRRSRDISQSIGLNGFTTRLDTVPRDQSPTPSVASNNSGQADLVAQPATTTFATTRVSPAEGAGPPAAGTGAATVPANNQPELLRAEDTAEKIAQERLRQAQIQTRRVEREEALEIGRYMLTEDAEAQIARTASMVLSTVESGFNQIADAIAAEFQVPRRDVLHTMTKSFRSVREAASKAFAEKAAAIERAEAEATELSEAEEDLT
jgi:hypothetical protein